MAKKYPKKTVSKHATVRLPRKMLSAIEDFLQTEEAKKMGFLHMTDIVTEAVREFLKEQGYYPMPRFELINHDENGLKIWDRQQRRVADIYIKPKGIWCTLCQKNGCEHVDYALRQPDVEEIITKKRKEGWELPEI
jgi:hypothetical protein